MAALRRPGVAWLALSGLLATGALGGWWLPRGLLDWQLQRLGAEPWRHVTAVWAHLDLMHLLANLAGAAVLAAFGRAAGCSLRDTAAWLVAWPLTHLLLLVEPEFKRYAGLSGVLHAGVVVAAFALLSRGQGTRRAIGALVMGGLLLKLLGEDAGAAPVRLMPGWNFPVAVLAHATGAAAGLLCAMVAWATSPRRAVRTIQP